MAFSLPNVVAGLMVGLVVGVTGVGGGSLMTPILVFLFGIPPQTAVGTDLLYASVTKVFGTAVHHRHGSVDWAIVRRLAVGSLPAAAATLVWMRFAGADRIKDGVIIDAVASALVLTALGMLFKDRLQRLGRNWGQGASERALVWQPRLTVAAGIVLGLLVTLTSIGAGALGTVMLVYLYPVRLNAARLVGTDLAHAIPLALIAGLGHLTLGNVDFPLLGNLLIGSIPGVLVGSLISSRAPVGLIRYCIAIVLTLVAVKMFLR
ncbi:MAG: sulfite exporter TauE/SafE family protein [Verrucomicrobia bacterium]|nr:sulfite exporter TauE/SafE family protein [Verrucomicrobiota bacterium]